MRRLGEWVAGARLGGGGYAEVFSCRGPGVPQAAALKVFADPTHVNTFEREVAALTRLDGAGGTPRLLDRGRDGNGRLCLVIERVSGIRLDTRLRQLGPLPPASLAAMVRQVLATLEAAHGRGLLHKDIKASNLLVDGERFTLIDWGVAEAIGDGRAEAIHAKQDIVAPECYFGRHGPATDFYALGWLIVFAATGRKPYRFDDIGDPDYRVAAHCLERAEVPPELPSGWRTLVASWIGKRPEARRIGYDLDALLAWAAGGPRLPPDDATTVDPRNIGRNDGYLRQAAQAGVPWACHELGRRALREGIRAQGLYWLEQAAAAGHARAARRLALALPDGAAARSWLEQAAWAGDAEACYRLGLRLLDEGARERALLLLAEAAGQGLRRAQHDYALAIRDCDAEAANAWLRAAAERGHEAACRRLADDPVAGRPGSTIPGG